MESPRCRSLLKALATVLVAVLSGAMLHGQTTSLPTKFEYTRTLWASSDGLPENTVQALAESAEGRLWIGTTGGLARFDGLHIEPERNLDQSQVASNSIFCITLSVDGNLWAGTEGGGLLRLRSGSVRVYTARDGLTDSFVRAVFSDSSSRLWVGTDNGLFRMEGERLVRVDDGGRMAPLAVHSIAEDRQHRIWAGGSRLISIDPGGAITEHALQGVYSQNRVKRILQTSDGTVWVGTVGGLQKMLPGGRFSVVPGIEATVRTLLETTDGALWIGTIGQGLWRMREGKLTRVSTPGLLPSDTILTLLEDDQHQVWIGTQAGLVRLVRTPISVVTLPESGDPDYETISGDDRGNVWVAAERLFLIRAGVARAVEYGGLGGAAVRNVYRAREGGLWIGTDGSGAFRIGPGGTTQNIAHYTAPGALTNNFIRGFLEARDGSMWIATDEGVSQLRGASAGKPGVSARTLNEADGLAYFSTRSLAEDGRGRIWIGTDRGLSCWDGGRFVKNEATDGLRGEKVWSILVDREGTLWLGTRDHGVYRDRAGVLDQFTTRQGLASDSIFQILEDRRGTFWITGPNNLSSVPGDEIERAIPSRDHPLSVQVYELPFGASDAQFYGGRQPSGYLAPDGSVWFPTSRGAVHLTAGEPDGGARPKVYLGDVLEDGREVNPSNGLGVAASVARLSLPFSAISLRPQHGVRFRYRLSDFDQDWVAAGATHVATYTNLGAGSYRFRVQAYDIANPEAVSEVDLEFTKQPFLYQTLWFAALCVLVLALLSWTVYQVRLRQLRNRFAAVLTERNRMAREMHDTVIQGCTGLSALLEAIAITPPTEQETRQQLLDFAREEARKTIGEARQAVWDMRHERENDVDLVEAIRTVAGQMTREFGVPVEFAHDAAAIALSASSAHEVLMTVREAVYNAVQHSGSPKVEIAARQTGGDLVVNVVDFGRGFAPGDGSSAIAESSNRSDGQAEGHYGILGMRERAQRLGGRFLLASAPGEGTRIELKVRLRENAAERSAAEKDYAKD